MLDIQYVSDLHIEEWPSGTSFYLFVTPVAPILILAGDIASARHPLFKPFLHWCSRNWHQVILVAGNHEYHCHHEPHTLDETDAHIRSLCKPNVHYLQGGDSCTLAGIRFIGATLWSAVDPSIFEYVSKNKKDYSKCWIAKDTTLTPQTSSELHERHIEQLEAALDEAEEETVIVITHFMPSLHLLEEHYRNERIHTCYASNDETLFRPTITAWICGHSHRATTWISPCGMPVYMNARGYNKETELTRTVGPYNSRACLRV